MIPALSMVVCCCTLFCCEGPPAADEQPKIEVDGIPFAVSGELPNSLVIAADDPRLPQLQKWGLVRRGHARSWGCEQAAGPPDTEGFGDIVTAWASSTPDDEDEWLELTYAEAVKPVAVHVVETYNPGALVKVIAVTGDMEAVLWKGADPTARDAGRGTSIVKTDLAVKTNTIRIYLASKDVPGWNEIDAVGMQDETGKIHWATSVTASSNYAGEAEPGWVLDPTAAIQRIEELERQVEQLRQRDTP